MIGGSHAAALELSRLSALHWRGPGQVTFAPRVPEIGEGGRAVTTVSFTEPGTYVLQAVADDTVFVTSTNVTVTVHPAP